jgi:hypothetical protein
MEYLRNYQLRKELGLLGDEVPLEITIERLYVSKVSDSLRAAFFPSLATTTSATIRKEASRSFTPFLGNSGMSPRSRSRLHSQLEESSSEMKQIIEALETRVDSLELRNSALSERLNLSDAENSTLREQISDLIGEREILYSQVKSLKSVMTTESSAEKVLERVSHSDQLEFKLEIYKQQIAMLTEELNQLKTSKRV